MSRFRGVSPVVAVALLILVAVATTALLYAWVSGVAQERPAAEATLRERIKIDAVKIEKGIDNINITEIVIRNIGEASATITAIYLFDQETGNILFVNTTLGTNTVVAPGDTLELVNPAKPSGGVSTVGVNTIMVIAVSESGVEATYSVRV